MSSLPAQVAAPKYKLSVNQQLNRRRIVLELRLPEGQPTAMLETIKQVLKRAGIGWIGSVDIDGRAVIIYTRTTMARYTQDRGRFYQRIRRQLDRHMLHSARVHAEYDPSHQKITQQRLRQAAAKRDQPRRRPASRRDRHLIFA